MEPIYLREYDALKRWHHYRACTSKPYSLLRTLILGEILPALIEATSLPCVTWYVCLSNNTILPIL